MLQIEFTKKTRRENDFLVHAEKLQEEIHSNRGEIENILNKLAISFETILSLKEVISIQSILNQQDE